MSSRQQTRALPPQLRQPLERHPLKLRLLLQQGAACSGPQAATVKCACLAAMEALRNRPDRCDDTLRTGHYAPDARISPSSHGMQRRRRFWSCERRCEYECKKNPDLTSELAEPVTERESQAAGGEDTSIRFLGLPDAYLAIHNTPSPTTDHSGCTNDVILTLTQCKVRGWMHALTGTLWMSAH